MAATEGKQSDAPAEGEPKPRLSLKERALKIRDALWAKVSPKLDGLRRVIQYIRHRPIISSAAILASATAITLLVTGWLLVYERSHRMPIAPPIATVLNKLDTGDYEAARDLAARVFAHGAQTDAERGTALYIIGAVTFRDAEVHEDTSERQRLYLLAARYLEEAHEYGMPASHKVDGLETLAQCYFNVDRYAKALPALRTALDEQTENRKDLLWMLTTAYIRDANPQWKKALESNKEFLAQPHLNQGEQTEALLLQARLLYQVGDTKGCLEQMAAIEDTAKTHAELIVIHGRLLMQEAEKLLEDSQLRRDGTNKELAAKKFAEAMEVLRKAKLNEAVGNEATRQASYLLAVCLQKLENYKAAETQFARTYSEFIGTPESMAAGLGEAEMQRQLGSDEEALRSYLRVMTKAGSAEEYHNPWVSLNEFRNRIEQAYNAYMKAQQYALAIELAGAMSPIFSESRGVLLRAEAQRTSADMLSRQAETQTLVEAKKSISQARSQYRQAGRSFVKLASLREATPDFSSDLWAAGECFLKGHEYDLAARFIQKYLDVEPRKRRPRALVSLGETQLARNQMAAALKPLLECLEFFSQDPDSYRARIVASQVYSELGNLEEAKRMLLANLESEALTPLSAEWRDSLFTLGRNLHAEAVLQASPATPLVDANGPLPLEELKKLEEAHLIFQEAVQRMTEALQRYPNTPQRMEIRYLVAESHRRMTRWPKAKIMTTGLDSTRTVMQQQIDQKLQAAADEYLALRDALTEKLERDELSEVETSILRNCVFARGDMLFELNKYREALEEYSLAVTRYQNQPEVLEALVQIANCLRALDQAEEARGTLKQAQYILQRIKTDTPFEKTTRYSRDEWNQLLTSLIAG